MPSVLAIISKKVFQGLMNRSLGAVAPLARYQSKNPAFAKLGPGDALILVTVPKDGVLWQVAVIEEPKQKGDAVVGTPNTTPITDITERLRDLVLADGKGINAQPGKLAMSLQTPRVLADTDVALLRGGTPRKRAAAKPPVAKSAVAKAPVTKARMKRSIADAPALNLKGGKLSKRAKALVEQVYKAPDDRALRGVLADQLLEDQHVWGELISLQMSDPKHHAKRIAQIIHQHAREIVGAIANVSARDDLEIEDGFLVRCRTGKSRSWTSADERITAAKAREWATVREVVLVEQPGTFVTALFANPALTNLVKIETRSYTEMTRDTPRDPWRILRDSWFLPDALAGMPAAELARVQPPSNEAARATLEAARAKRAKPRKRR